MDRRLLTSALLGVVLLSVTSASADIPRKFHYQALLQSPAGELLNGEVDLRVQIFDAQVGGSSLWSENPILQMEAGRLDLTLPMFSPGFDDQVFDELLAAPQLWIEIVAIPASNREPIAFPRQQILSSGFALGTASIDGARGGTVDGSVEVVGDLRLPDGIELRTVGGSLVIDSPSSSITMAPDGTLTIESSNVVINSTGSLDLSAASDVLISGKNVGISAAANCTVEGQNALDLTTGGTLTALGSLINLN